ncbi:MAG: metallophosphoesterase family protein [Planctomycetota bacterium]
MRRALVSDIHGNRDALDAVMRDIAAQSVAEILCLGDVIGYGPEPRECLEQASSYTVCLLGNHEDAALRYSEDFNEKARVAIEWTRQQLNSRDHPREQNHRYWGFIGRLQPQARCDGVLLVHGSPRDPVREYILPRDARNQEKMGEIFSLIDGPVCFVGHSHVPGVYTEDGRYLSPRLLPDGYLLGSGKVLVNVGSVGQPRDGDSRASYVIWDDERVLFRRVEYDFRTTMRKIIETGALPRYLADRLETGR